jgi:hypothetical protein
VDDDEELYEMFVAAGLIEEDRYLVIFQVYNCYIESSLTRVDQYLVAGRDGITFSGIMLNAAYYDVLEIISKILSSQVHRQGLI